MKRFALALTGLLLLATLLACSRMNDPAIKDVSPTPEITQSTPSDTEMESIIVHNARELIQQLGSNKHFLLVPGGDYDLNSIDDNLNPHHFDGALKDLKNVIIEGQGEERVDFVTGDPYENVLYLKNCENITIRNLNLGHELMNLYDYCKGSVMFLLDNRKITLENCTLFGSGSIGIEAERVSGLNCNNVVIKECTSYIVYFNQIHDALFSNCEFISKGIQPLDIIDSQNITIENSRLTGIISNYPNVLENDKELLSLPHNGESHTVDEQISSNIRMANVTVTGKALIKELETLYPSVKADVIYYEEPELGGLPALDCILRYPSAPKESEYLSQIEQAKRMILAKEGIDGQMYVYISLQWPDTDDDVLLSFDGTIWLGNNYTDIANVMNDQRKYLSKEDARALLESWWPPLVNNKSKKIVKENVSFNHEDVAIFNGVPYYVIDVDSDYGEYEFGQRMKVNAVDGSIHMFFDGDQYAPVQPATQGQVNAVMEYIRSEEGLSEDYVYRAYAVKGEYGTCLIFMNRFTNTRYTIKTVNGKLVAEPYSEWMGD